MIHIKRNNYFGLQDIFVAMRRHLFGCNSTSNKFKIWICASDGNEKKNLNQVSCYLVAFAVSFTC